MLIIILSVLVVAIIGIAMGCFLRMKRNRSMVKQKPIVQRLPNGNVLINGKEYLSEEASRILEAAGNAADPRFEGTKYWN